MAKTKKQEKKVFTSEEKKEFVANNFKVMFWAEKELVNDFDEIVKDKGLTRKDGIIKLMEKFVAKNKKG